MRGVGTIWRGSAFNCNSSGNEIYLLERHYLSNSDTTCNNGMITGQVVWIDESNYTSQLNVTLEYDSIGKTIECAYIDGKQNPTVTSVAATVINLRTYVNMFVVGHLQ